MSTTQQTFQGCPLYAFTPVVLDATNIQSTDAEVEANIGEWSPTATYSKGQPAIRGSILWAAKEDGVTGDSQAPYETTGTSLLAWDSSVVSKSYVPWWVSTRVFKVGDYCNVYPYVYTGYDVPAATIGKQYKAKVAGTGTALPTDGLTDANWEFIADPYTSYVTTRTDIENGAEPGEWFWSVSQGLGFVAIGTIAASPLNYLPYVDQTEQKQITELSKWVKVRDLNPYLIFDSSPSTQTERLGELNYVLNIARPFTNLVLLNMEGAEVHLTIKSSTDETIHDVISSLRKLQSSPYELYYNYEDKSPDLYITELPVAFDSTVELKVTAYDVDELAKLGGIYLGVANSIGIINARPTKGSNIYTTKDDAAFVGEQLTRKYSHKIEFAEFPVSSAQGTHDTMVQRLDKIITAESENIPSIFYGMYGTLDTFKLLGNITKHSQVFDTSKTTNIIRVEGIS